MKQALFLALWLAGVSLTPAFAMEANGKVDASMMKNGDVKMMIQLPPKEYYAIDRRLEDFPGQSYTKILECGPNM
jgi:hypothetical protein